MSDMTPSAASNNIPQWALTDRLRKAREAAGLRQEDMANRLAKSRAAVAGWERGHHKPDELALRAWAFETGVPLEWLKFGTEESPDSAPTSTKWQRGPYRAPPGTITREILQAYVPRSFILCA